MRSAVISIVLLVVLVGGFALFMQTQGTTHQFGGNQTISTPTSLPRPIPAMQGDVHLGTGDDVWLISYDSKTGAPTNAFKADRYDPPVGNKLHVIHPVSRFFSKNGQVLMVSAAYGDMVLAEGAKKPGQMQAFTSQPPQTGVLHEVTLDQFEDDTTTTPTTTLTVPILAFDSDTLRMNSIDWKNGDLLVPADQVPVTVRGRDYDFDGQGLTLRYNQRDQHLEFLQIAHGRRLLIKNTKAFGTLPTPSLPSPGTQSAAPGSPVQWNGRPLELAAADATTGPRMSAEERALHQRKREAATQPAAVARRARMAATRQAPTATTKPARELVAYRAHFEKDLRITEGATPVGSADELYATFTFDQEKSSTTQPTTAPADARAEAERVPTSVATETAPRARRTPATHASGDLPTVAKRATQTQPAIESADADTVGAPGQPIEITWVGRLTVIPEKMIDAGLRSASDRIVEFSGTPVHLQRDGSSVVAPYVWAGLEGDRFKAVGSDAFPDVVLQNADGGKLTTGSIEADGDTVLVHGKSVAEATVTQNGGAPATVVTRWTDRAELKMLTTDAGTRALQNAVFQGDVTVQHPQLRLNGDALSLGFDAVAGSEKTALKSIHVEGHVRAGITQDDGSIQSIASRVLDLGTVAREDGTVSVNHLHATGEVQAENAQQKLQADDLVAAMTPPSTTQPTEVAQKMNVDQMTATGNVRFTTTDGVSAGADQLKIDRNGDVQQIALSGTPARVKSLQSNVTGNLIQLDSTGNHASVVGAGTMDTVASQSQTTAPHPVHVAWKKSFTYDAVANTAQVLGDVAITSPGTDGSVDRASGPILDIALADAPTTQPAGSTPLKTAPTTKPAPGSTAMGNKTVKSMVLHGEDPKADSVEVSSLTYAIDDPTRLLKRTYMFVPLIDVQMNTDGSLGKLTVPSAGKMLYENLASTTQPAPGAAPANPQGLNANGTIAMEWKKDLVFDPASHKAVLSGDVVVAHQAPGQDLMRMLAPRLVAEFEDSSSSQIKQVVADQGATFIGKTMRFDAPQATYQPQNDRVIAQGTARQPVQVYDQSGLSKGSIGEMWWNIKTNQPERIVNVSGQIAK